MMGIEEKSITKDEITTRMDVIFEILNNIYVQKGISCLSESLQDKFALILTSVMDFRLDIRREILDDFHRRLNNLKKRDQMREQKEEIKLLDKELGNEES